MRDYVRSIRAAARSAHFSASPTRVAFPSGRIDAILRAPLTAEATASFTCALHARCVHGCAPRESGVGGGRDGGCLLPFSFRLLFSLSE